MAVTDFHHISSARTTPACATQPVGSPTGSAPDRAETAVQLRRASLAERRRAEWVRELASDLPGPAGAAARRHASAHALKSLVFELQSEAFDR